MTEPSIEVPKRSGISGFAIILAATAGAGALSYVVTWLVPRQIGLASYSTFAIFWASIYLVVGTLSGVQQEITRATHPIETAPDENTARARNFGVISAVLIFLAVIVTAPLWVHSVFPTEGWSLVWPLAAGTASFVTVAVLCGSLYGVSEWRPLAAMISVDAVMRLLAISVALLFTHNVVALAWAVAIPFPLTIAVLWFFIRRYIVGRSQLDVGYRVMIWNVARTIVAALSTSIMVSGFPLVLSLTARAESRAIVGLYILTITLSRAPLIVVAMSLQSYFIVMFRNNATHFWGQFVRIQALILGAGIVLALVGWAIGPLVFSFLFPQSLSPSRWFIAMLVISSAFVGALCVSAPAVLARSQHLVYTSGWLVAAAVTIITLLLPLDFTTRTLLALLCGPVAGQLVHGAYLAAVGIRERTPAS